MRLFFRLISCFLSFFAFFPNLAGSEEITEISVSYVASPFNVPSIIMHAKGYLKESFESVGIDVKEHEITSGAKQMQALAAKEIDIASVLGGSSAIIARSNNIDVKIVSAYSRNPKAFGIFVRHDGPIEVKDLKGKIIAGPKGTVLHQLLLASLKANGMRIKDVKHINMDIPAARAALLAKKVDAAMLAGNNALMVEKEKGRLLISGEGLIRPTTVIAARGELAKNRPEIVARYLSAHRMALDFMKENPEETLKIAAEKQKISIEDAKRMMSFYNFDPDLTEEDVENLKADQDFLISVGMLKRKIDIEKDLMFDVF